MALSLLIHSLISKLLWLEKKSLKIGKERGIVEIVIEATETGIEGRAVIKAAEMVRVAEEMIEKTEIEIEMEIEIMVARIAARLISSVSKESSKDLRLRELGIKSL